MPPKRRRAKGRAAGLDFDSWVDLMYGPNPYRPVYASPFLRRAAWATHKNSLLAECQDTAHRPQAWWEYDLGRLPDFSKNECQVELLVEIGQASEDELATFLKLVYLEQESLRERGAYAPAEETAAYRRRAILAKKVAGWEPALPVPGYGESRFAEPARPPKGVKIDEAAAFRACFFIESLRHWEGDWAGVPFILSPWQREEIVRPLLGALRSDRTRRFRKAYISVACKNGKTALMAAVALYLFMADGEPGGQVYSAAADRKQAALIFDAAIGMLEQCPFLRRRVDVLTGAKMIRLPAKSSRWQVLSADAPTKHGLNASVIIFDELHAQPTDALWNVLITRMGARRQPLLIAITTAGNDETSICHRQYEYAEKILAGVFPDESFFAYIREAPKDADWRDEAVWYGPNPGLGVFRNLDELRTSIREAERVPANQNNIRNLYLNQWVKAESRWIDLYAWDLTAGMVDEAALEGRPCYAGLDLAASQDLSALALVFPMDTDPVEYKIICRFWLPEEGLLERRRRDNVSYDVWAGMPGGVANARYPKFIELTPGNVIDYSYIRRAVRELAKRYRIVHIAYDPWGARQLAQEFQEDGVGVAEFNQWPSKFASPTREFERLVLTKRLHHGGNPVLRFMMDCCQVRSDSNGNVRPVKPDRQKSHKRIDGVVATIMALDGALRNEAAQQKSAYESHGLETIGF